MKLVIQIPCRDEEESLPRTLSDLPRRVPGFESVEWVLVDDGSVDGSANVAREWGVDEVVSLPGRCGLAAAFAAGLEASLRRGADAIVNTDADNQYRGEDVRLLVQPILAGEADMVVGARPIREMGFSLSKRLLQRLGSAVVRRLSGAAVPDATSGFRAFTRDAALRLSAFSTFSHTIETIVQLGVQRARIAAVPVRVNRVDRPSRLFGSTAEFVRRQAWTLLHVYVLYRPFELFATAGTALVVLGLVPGARFLVLYAAGQGQGHVQSLLLALLLILLGGLLLLASLLASLVTANRVLLEEVRLRLRRHELDERHAGTAAAPRARRDP